MADYVILPKNKLDTLAQHINEKAGTSGAKTIAQMQETVDSIVPGITDSSIGAVRWNEKFTKMLSPSTAETAAPVTVKALCYCDGYWYGAGNDSLGDLYKLYGATAENLTAVKLASDRAFSAKGIVCDGTRVWVCCGDGAYKNRTILFQSIADFRSSNTAYTYSAITLSSYSYEDICRTGSDSAGYESCVFVAGQTGEKGLIVRALNGSTDCTYQNYPDVSGGFISCCSLRLNAYDAQFDFPVFITANGYICNMDDKSAGTISGQTFECLQGAKMVRCMNEQIFVACVKSDGTYLYKFPRRSVPSGDSAEPSGIKITSEALAIVGMAYAGGLYTVVGVNNSGVAKVLQSDNAFLTGIYGQTITLPGGYTPRVMGADTENICILADNGSNVVKAMCAIN